MKKNNIIDKLLNFYEEQTQETYSKERYYDIPSKKKSIIYFIIGLIMMFIIIRFLFGFNLIFFILFFPSLIFTIYYGINTFSKKGIGWPKYRIKKEKKE